MTKPPFPDQVFESFRDWAASGFVRDQFASACFDGTGRRCLCFDAMGRQCLCGDDMSRARDENTFPVWWVWPDQIPELVRRIAELEAKQKEDE